MAYQPSREAERIALWLRSLGHADIARLVLLGMHWEWHPGGEGAAHGTPKSGHARTGPRR